MTAPIPKMSITLARQLLAEGYRVVVPVRGTSMMPTLGTGDSVELVAISRVPRLGELVLTWAPVGEPTLHRVVWRGRGWIQTAGDANVGFDERVAVEHVLARVATPAGKPALGSTAWARRVWVLRRWVRYLRSYLWSYLWSYWQSYWQSYWGACWRATAARCSGTTPMDGLRSYGCAEASRTPPAD